MESQKKIDRLIKMLNETIVSQDRIIKNQQSMMKNLNKFISDNKKNKIKLLDFNPN